MTIRNRLGLHARPATVFAETASGFNADVHVARADSDHRVDGKSIMQLLMLAATAGTPLVIEASGGDAQEAVDALVALIESAFGEE